MIRRLRKKMVVTIMSFITVFLALLIAMITLIPINQIEAQTKKTLKKATQSYKSCLRVYGDDKKITYTDLDLDSITENLVIIEASRKRKLLNWTANRLDLYTDKDILRMMDDVEAGGRKFGIVNGYYYLRKRAYQGRILYTMIDTNSFYDAIVNSLIWYVVFGIMSWCLCLWLTLKIVEKMLEPVKESMHKQKQFIADAGHELKTPVAVITANANVLEREIGPTKWLTYITMEAQRMQSLIKSLMTLAELEDSDKFTEFESFDLSNAVMGATLPYESLAYEKGTIMQCKITENIRFYGNKERIIQMVSALVSNAVAYCNTNGKIQISLKQKKKEIELSVYNTGIGIRKSDRKKVFERFYRVDPSRKRDHGNYGLGLSIVQSIVKEHHGKIRISGTYQEDVCFTILFLK